MPQALPQDVRKVHSFRQRAYDRRSAVGCSPGQPGVSISVLVLAPQGCHVRGVVLKGFIVNSTFVPQVGPRAHLRAVAHDDQVALGEPLDQVKGGDHLVDELGIRLRNHGRGHHDDGQRGLRLSEALRCACSEARTVDCSPGGGAYAMPAGASNCSNRVSRCSLHRTHPSKRPQARIGSGPAACRQSETRALVPISRKSTDHHCTSR
mmetsp:Transcript_158850/g.509315  ORF Transcript_158850/g.509315 Transcript_158850/m.509315 type:complete len:207 (-) Transcript_158850:130-750(-)